MEPTSFDSVYDLPVFTRRDEILSAVDANQVTIITAETGAGKSTQIPQYLAEHGYRKIIVTQPRILAARNLSHRVRQEYAWRTHQATPTAVGYRTAHERDDDPENVILYCTDGLQLVRELTGSGTRDKQVLILDEIHEWNENMEVLIAWAKKRCQEDPGFKVVLMSATIEADGLATYFGCPPPLAIEGRYHPVEKRQGEDLLQEIITVAQAGPSNMLVFLPGKAEIENIGDALQNMVSAPIIPLHSQLTPEAQQQAFAHYPGGKIVLSTNVAQTSVTIDDIDAVIDSGLERRAEVRNGVEGLFIAEVSQADCLQRAGRAGRVKPGLYVLAQLDTLPCSPLAERPAYGVPEIMRKHIDRLVLRLAAIGIDIEDLEFYHSPSRRTIKLAKQTLRSLGALDSNGLVTEIGHKMERFPVESGYARMLVEAEPYSATVQSQLATIIAIQEVGGIVKGGSRYSGWRAYTHQSDSDLIAEYDVLRALPGIPTADYEDLGIIDKNVIKAQEVAERLHRDLGLGENAITPIDPANVTTILRCIVAGQVHQLWLIEHGGQAINIATKDVRELSSNTVIRRGGLAAGTPFDLEVPTEHGELETLHLVNDLTTVHPAWLPQIAPGLFAIRPAKKYFDERSGLIVTRILVTFRDQTFEIAAEPVLDHTPENEKLFQMLYAVWLREKLDKEYRQLHRANPRLPRVSLKQIRQKIHTIAPGAISLAELPKSQRSELAALSHMEAYVGADYMRSLRQPHSHHARHHGRSHHHRWQPRHKRRHHSRDED